MIFDEGFIKITNIYYDEKTKSLILIDEDNKQIIFGNKLRNDDE